MIFSKFNIEDCEKISGFFASFNSDSCEATFMNCFIWQDYYGIKYAFKDGIILVRYGKSKEDYMYLLPPYSKENFEILKEVSSDNLPDIWAFEGENFEKFKEDYKDYYHFSCTLDNDDYIYNSYDLAVLPGKKFHSKRNHIANFSKNHNWKYEDITSDNADEVKKCAILWFDENNYTSDERLICERESILKILDNFDSLPVFGGLIRADGKAVAFTIGSAVNEKTADVHFEKALADYQTGYSVINREFAAKAIFEFEFLNREDDMGIPGIRKAKLSYHPAKKLKKYYCFKKSNSKYDKYIDLYCSAFGWDKQFDPRLFELLGESIKAKYINNSPVSMIFAIECKLVAENKKYKAIYIYGAVTKESARNKGYMRELIKEIAQKSDCFVFLKPADGSLKSFYEKCGFKSIASADKKSDIYIEVSDKHKKLQKLCDKPVGKSEFMYIGYNFEKGKELFFEDTLE